MPARCAHLMPQEGGNRDEECGAHKKWWRKYSQILEHRAHLPSARHDLCQLRPVWVPPAPGWAAPHEPANGPAGGRRGPLPAPQVAHDANQCSGLTGILADHVGRSPAGPPEAACPRRPAPRWPATSMAADSPSHTAAIPPSCRPCVAVSERPRGPTMTGERTATACSTLTSTSTPDSPVPAAGTATSSISPGGRAARGSLSWVRATSRIRDGRMS
jgi:hypothetical protein